MGKHLLIACAVGDLQWLQLCVEKGADPTFVNNEVICLFSLYYVNKAMASKFFKMYHL